jgi:hypothetical protein
VGAAAGLDLDDDIHFPTLRRRLRTHLAQTPVGVEIDELVTELIG